MRLAALLFLCLTAADAGDARVTVTDAWVRAGPPGAGMLAGFMTLTNAGDEPRRLVAADSPAFGDVSIHRTRIEDGMARMRPVDGVDLLPGEPVAFEPGGLHLMLMGPARVLRPGDEVILILAFADGSRLEVTAPVRRPGGGDR